MEISRDVWFGKVRADEVSLRSLHRFTSPPWQAPEPGNTFMLALSFRMAWPMVGSRSSHVQVSIFVLQRLGSI